MTEVSLDQVCIPIFTLAPESKPESDREQPTGGRRSVGGGKSRLPQQPLPQPSPEQLFTEVPDLHTSLPITSDSATNGVFQDGS